MRLTPILLVAALAACTSNAVTGGLPTQTSPAGTPSAAASSIGGPPPEGRPIDVSALEGRIVFSSETDDVWTADADGSHVRRVTDAKAQEFDPTWSPDGSKIAYRHQTDGGDTTEIYVVAADGSHPTPLTRNDVADWGPDWSPDGLRIVWNSAMGTGGFGFFGTTIRPTEPPAPSCHTTPSNTRRGRPTDGRSRSWRRSRARAGTTPTTTSS